MYTVGMLIDDTFDTGAVDTPCLTRPEIFVDPALDVDDDVFAAASAEEKTFLAESKSAAEERALNACARCPLLTECRTWARSVDVFGVAGGLRHSERHAPCEVDLWEGAESLRVSQTSSGGVRKAAVSRRRTARWATMATPTMKLFHRLIVEGKMLKQEAIVHMLSFVDDGIAEKSAPSRRSYPTVAARRDAGARRYVYNLLRIQIRSGNIIEMFDGEESVLTLDPEVAQAWQEWVSSAAS